MHAVTIRKKKAINLKEKRVCVYWRVWRKKKGSKVDDKLTKITEVLFRI